MSSQSLSDKTGKKALFDRPFALSIGPQRAGTSWLDRYLRAREDVCMPDNVKEVFFFDRHFERGPGFYASHFSPLEGQTLLMEISTTSFDHEDAPQRVFEVFGKDIRLICPLRHPVIRSYSLYLHYLRYGIVRGSLRSACFQNPQILESSHYAKHLQRWLDVYDLKQIHLLFQEDLEADQDQYVRKACEALDIPYIAAPKDVADRYNVTAYSRFGFLAGAVQNTADWLRQHRMYGVVNFAKALGLKRFVFGEEDSDAGKTTIPEEDRMWLQEQLGEQVELLEKITGPIQQWRS